MPNKSLMLTFPTFIKTDLISHFIRGYFDGDGCIYFKQTDKKYKYNICPKISLVKEFSILGTKNFCFNIKNIFSSIGVNGRRIDKIKNIFRFRCTGASDIKIIYNFIYKNKKLFLKRKFTKFNELINLLEKNDNLQSIR